ncbi:carbon-nitrogen hydrolase [Trichoderma barbatum]
MAPIPQKLKIAIAQVQTFDNSKRLSLHRWITSVDLGDTSRGAGQSSIAYFCPKLGIIGKRRKVMPTGLERVAWGQGSPSTLKSSAICWEIWMPLLRQNIYEKNINLFLGPTAHATKIWVPLMQTISIKRQTFVLSATPCSRANDLSGWNTKAAERGDEIVSRGGSVIVTPRGSLLADDWVIASRARRDAFGISVGGMDMKRE